MAWHQSLLLVQRELVARPRHRWFRWQRLITVALGGGILALGWWLSRATMSTTVGLTLFTYLMMTTLGWVHLLAPLAAANSITEERAQRTFPVLWLTDLSPGLVLVGKLLSGLLSSAVAVGAMLPLMILCVSFGGIASAQILLAVALLVSTILLGCALGLFAAAACRRERDVRGLLALLLIGLYAGLPLVLGLAIAWLEDRFGGAARSVLPPLADLFTVISPMTAMFQILQGRLGPAIYLHLAAGLMLAAVLLLAAGRLLPRTVHDPDKLSWRQRFKAWMRRRPLARKLGRVPPLHGNPVLWREINFRQSGWRAIWVKSLLLAGVVVGGAALIYLGDKCDYRWRRALAGDWVAALWDDEFYGVLCGTLAVLSGMMLAGQSLSLCSRAFVADRQQRALELLFTTDLRDGEVLWGKIGAVLAGILPWLLLLPLSLLPLLYFDPPRASDVGDLMLAVLYGVFAWLCYSAFCLALAVRWRRALGLPLALVLYAVVSIGLGVALRPSSETSYLTASIVVHAVLLVTCAVLTTASFREHLLREN